jgi:hypothetical protein
LAAALILTLGAACSKESPSSSNPKGSPGRSQTDLSSHCHVAEGRLPRWLPPQLPLPKGTFATDELAASPGQHRAIFVVPLGIRALTDFVHNRWAAAGYTLGRTEVTDKQVSGSFVKPPSRGTFLAQASCGKGKTIVLLAFEATSSSPSSS